MQPDKDLATREASLKAGVLASVIMVALCFVAAFAFSDTQFSQESATVAGAEMLQASR
ncbi:MAG: hypothetical protein SXU28_00900 [Pseudomonadota bacterium]|nr:hypothetical protein [Pseudomonadota bacterium]